MDASFDTFIEERVLPQYRDIVRAFCAQMARVAPEATGRIRGGTEKYYGVPVYKVVRDIVAISPTKTGVTFSFTAGAGFTDPAGLLSGAGKQSRTVRVRKIGDYPEAAMEHYIRQGVETDLQRS